MGAVALVALVLAAGCASTVHPVGSARPVTKSSATASASTRPCPPAWSPAAGHGVAVDYVDTVRIAGHDFIYQPDAAQAAARPVVGAPLGRVQCQITAHPVDPAYRLQDGDATYLPVGTTLYAVAGQDPAKVVAVRDAGGIRLYRAPQTAR